MTSEENTETVRQQTEPGIRGGLLAFVIWIGIVSPVWTLVFSIFMVFWLERGNPGDAELMRDLGWDVLLWVVTIVRTGLRVAAGLFMYLRRTSTSVWISLAVLWISGPLLILGTWAVVEGEISVAGLVRSAIIALAWTLFLIMSRRVKITYNFRNAA